MLGISMYYKCDWRSKMKIIIIALMIIAMSAVASWASCKGSCAMNETNCIGLCRGEGQCVDSCQNYYNSCMSTCESN
jgi:hypothetical protein